MCSTRARTSGAGVGTNLNAGFGVHARHGTKDSSWRNTFLGDQHPKLELGVNRPGIGDVQGRDVGGDRVSAALAASLG